MPTLFEKVWNAHTVRTLPSGQSQLFVGLHLVHEVTSPQAFDMLRQHGWNVPYPERTFATVDHIVPTSSLKRPFLDVTAEEMTAALERNCRQFGIRLYAPGTEGADSQGIVHVIGPELGLTQPGMTIACGDSHTSTHGALGAIAFGIGTSQVRDVLASQCLSLDPLKVRRIEVDGELPPGVYAKDVILTIIRTLGVNGGNGYAYEYAGTAVDRMTIEERMTICNMSIEGGARAGYVNPDETTFAYLRGRRFAPAGAAFDRAMVWWRQIASDADARYDDRVRLDAAQIEPTVTWGINPGQSVGVRERIAADADEEALPRTRTKRRSRSWDSSAAPRSKAHASMWRSSARARTAGSPISKRPQSWCAAAVSPRTSRPSWCPVPRPSGGPRRRRASIRSSRRRGSSGGAPAVRCVWR
jgi:3-isopropylmalate/(R)-2-methylmalate dehydratase large subunit